MSYTYKICLAPGAQGTPITDTVIGVAAGRPNTYGSPGEALDGGRRVLQAVLAAIGYADDLQEMARLCIRVYRDGALWGETLFTAEIPDVRPGLATWVYRDGVLWSETLPTVEMPDLRQGMVAWVSQKTAAELLEYPRVYDALMDAYLRQRTDQKQAEEKVKCDCHRPKRA